MNCIAAISTPPGEGGIAIVRISGDDALAIAFKIVQIKTLVKKIEERKFYYGRVETKQIKDEIMFVYFKAPKSYTCEDLVEIHCHGNGLIASQILNELILNGASLAQNGEFTKRAFLNHRIDLTQAESVIDLINAQSVSEINSAYDALSGALYKKIEKLQNKIVQITAGANAAVDYPEEGLEEQEKSGLKIELESLIGEMEELIGSYNESVLIKEGVKIAIVGKPNVGKSMLLNALSLKDRAIVTDIPGTTRDTLDEQYSYKGLRFIITDTAGIRETENEIERIGIERSFKAIKGSDIVLAVLNAGEDHNKEFSSIKNGEKENEKQSVLNGKRVVYVYNKIDQKSEDFIRENSIQAEDKIYISAKENINISALKEKIFCMCNGEKISIGGARLNNSRHLNAACEALKCLVNAQNNLFDITLDCIISDLHHAYTALGTITGATSSDEIVGEIFSRFCVGK